MIGQSAIRFLIIVYMAVATVSVVQAQSQTQSQIIPEVLANNIHIGVTQHIFVSGIVSAFKFLTHNASVLDQALIDRVADNEARVAVPLMMQVFDSIDAHHVGRISEAELREYKFRVLESSRALEPKFIAKMRAEAEDQVQDMMKADTNHDGFIDREEMKIWAGSLGSFTLLSPGLRALLALSKDGHLTEVDLTGLAEAAFKTVDLDGDGKISAEEYASFKDRQSAAHLSNQK